LLDRTLVESASGAGGAQLSAIHADVGQPSQRLLEIAAAAVAIAPSEDLSEISARIQTGPRWPDVWPGEHYKLLSGLVRTLRPQVVVEIGTYRGHSALALARNLPPEGRLYTFDVIPSDRIPGNILLPEDFRGGKLQQVIADLTAPTTDPAHRALLESAGLIFVDAANDGAMEARVLDRFESLRFANDPIVVFDDIRVWNMLRIWRDVTRPKLDLTSFGHWSGTGLIDWNGAPRR